MRTKSIKVFKMGENYYSQALLQEYKYIVKITLNIICNAYGLICFYMLTSFKKSEKFLSKKNIFQL